MPKSAGYSLPLTVRFAKAIFTVPIVSRGISISFVQCLLIIIAVLIGLWYFSINKKEIIQLGIILIGTAILYSGMMLGTYLFLFSESEALNLACFDRYMSTYIYASLIIIILYILKHFSCRNLVVIVTDFMSCH